VAPAARQARWSATGGLLVLLILFSFWPWLRAQLSGYVQYVQRERHAYQTQAALAEWAPQQSRAGVPVCGYGWWIPWDIAFLGDFDPCDLCRQEGRGEARFILLPLPRRAPPADIVALLKTRGAAEVRPFAHYTVYEVPPEISRWVRPAELVLDLEGLVGTRSVSVDPSNSVRYPLSMQRDGDARTAVVQIAPSGMVFHDVGVQGDASLLMAVAALDAGGWLDRRSGRSHGGRGRAIVSRDPNADPNAGALEHGLARTHRGS